VKPTKRGGAAMKRILSILTLGILISASGVSADTFSFRPAPQDLQDLVHQSYYTWGINWSVPAGQSIVAMELYINQIDDWTNEMGDHLYIHFLNSVSDANGGSTPNYGTLGSPYNFYQTITIIRSDNEGGGDNFNAQGYLVVDYSDPGPGNVNLSYGILPLYWSWVDGNFGFGFDPDCHYYNSYIELRITTAPSKTPEPATLLLLACGLAGLAGGRRLMKR
jgi:hypothetical protein